MRIRWFTIFLIPVLSCTDSQARLVLSNSHLDALDRGRADLDATELQPLPPILTLSASSLDEESGFNFTTPVSIAATGSPLSILAVADRGDRAIHLFSLSGEYQRSLVSREHLSAVLSVAVSRAGRVYAYDLGHGTLIRFAGKGNEPLVRNLGKFIDDVPHTSEITVDGKDRIYEHWFAGPYPKASEAWSEDLPIIRVLDADGRTLGGIGRVEMYPGSGALTGALNSGHIDVSRDTVWFARAADARILAYPTELKILRPARVIETPLFYTMRPPFELTDHTIRRAVVEYHVVAFAVDPRGRLFLGQSVSYPDLDELFRPRTALTVLSADGGHLGSFDVEYEILDLSVTEKYVFALLRVPGEGREVTAFPNPVY